MQPLAVTNWNQCYRTGDTPWEKGAPAPPLLSWMAQHGPLMLLSVALFVSGVQFVSMGLLGELIARTYYESQNKPVYALREVKSHRKDVGDTEQTRPSGSSER